MLGITHTTVSRRLSAIQSRLGTVFEREPGGYYPTPLGNELLEVAERMEQLSLTATRRQRATSPELSGSIRLSLPEAVAQYLLTDDLVFFAEQYPAIDLVVETSYSFVNLDKSEADIVVRGAENPPGHLVGRRLFPTRVTYYADRNYLENTPKSELRWIAPLSDGMWPWWLQASPYPFAPVALKIDDITARHRALVRGLGLGRGACFMADPEPNLIRLTDDPPVAQQDFWVLTHPDLKNTPRIKTLMQFLISSLKKKQTLVSGAR